MHKLLIILHCAYLVSYSFQINFPGWVAGLVENKANSVCSADLKLELDWAWQNHLCFTWVKAEVPLMKVDADIISKHFPSSLTYFCYNIMYTAPRDRAPSITPMIFLSVSRGDRCMCSFRAAFMSSNSYCKSRVHWILLVGLQTAELHETRIGRLETRDPSEEFLIQKFSVLIFGW